MKYQKVRKIISFISSLNLVLQSFFPLAVAMPVYAEEATPAAVIEASPAPEVSPEVTPEITPEVTPESTPTPEISVTPEPTPSVEITPEPSASPAPEVSPEVTPEITPEPTAEITPAEQQNNEEPQNNSPPAEQNNTPAATPTPEPTISLPQPLTVISELEQEAPAITPAITTDKSDYFPTDTVNISGTGFQPNTTYSLHIYSNDNPIFNYRPEVTSDENGSFAFSFTLDGNYRPNYKIEALDSSGTIIISYSFTDTVSVTNPTLSQSCGLDIALVLDTSGSISNDELTQMKNAFIAFVDALNGTPTQYSVTQFNSVATIVQNFTSDTSLVKSKINGVTKATGTNWQDGLVKANSTLPNRSNPNLVLFASDGNPNHSGTSGNDVGESSALASAVTAANSIKSGGTRILAFGIGDGLDTDNLKAISGNSMNTGNVLTSDVITTNFSSLATQLSTFAKQTCGGKISVNKYIENVQTGGGQTWSFKIDNTTTITTDSNGQAVSGTLSVGKHTISEVSIPSGYSFSNATCTNGKQDKPNNGVNDIDITNDSVITCNFYNTVNYTPTRICHANGNGTYISETPANSGQLMGHVGVGHQNGNDIIPPIAILLPSGQNWTAGEATWTNGCVVPPVKGTLIVQKVVTNNDGGTKTASDFSFRINGDTAISFEADGQNDISLNPGKYSVTEVPVTGYSITYSNCNNISLAAGQTKTCVIYNNDIAPFIKVTKVVKGSSEPITSFPLFVKDATHSYSVNSGQKYNISAGSYVVSETNKAGFTASITGDCAPDGSITLNVGDDKSCTITNTRDPYCGDRIVNQLSEACDDGNNINGDGCSATCQIEKGSITACKYKDADRDGVKDDSEISLDWSFQIDGGVFQNTVSGCYTFSNLDLNKTYTITENSDSGYSSINPASHSVSLTNTHQTDTVYFGNYRINVCGDGFKDSGEACDDGNLDNTDSCTNKCTVAICGDGFIQSGEQCDDGNTVNNDACTNACTNPRCGDAIVNGVEECDDGNSVNDDSCDNSCTLTSNVTICKENIEGQKLSGWDVALASASVDGPRSINVANNTGTNSTDLPTGHYLIKVSGTYRYGNNAMIADAGYSFRPLGIPDGTGGWVSGFDLSGGSNGLMALVNSTAVNWGALNTSNHTYTYLYNHTSNGPINISIYDNIYGDNLNNNFQFEIYQIPAGYFGTTEENGCVTFNNVLKGSYVLDELLKADWVNITGKGETVQVDDTQEIFILQNKLDLHTGKITIVKNVDTNADRVVEISNSTDWTWDITGGEQNIATGQTRTLNLGNYTISEDQKDGYTLASWSCTDGTRGTANSIPVAISKNGVDITCTLTNVRDTGSIVVNKVIDADGDVNTTSDQTIGANWQFDVDGLSADTTDASANTTDSSGSVTFSTLKTGSYTIIETAQSGYDLVYANCDIKGDTFDNEDSIDNVAVTAGNVVNCYFYNTPSSSIHGYKWSDVDGDGQKDSAESLLSGWTISLYQSEGDGFGATPIATMNTSNNNHTGWYWFENLVPGEYKVCETPQTGWTQTFPTNTDGDTCHYVSLPNGSSGTLFEESASGNLYNFGNIQLGKINVTKYNDLDGDGIQDENERVLGGWSISLTDNDNKTTGEDGKVSFSDLNPNRSYTLGETMQGGWVQTNISCTVNNYGNGVKITKPNQAYGHHGYCGGWNDCGDAATCAKWACQSQGYSNLVSYGESRPCTQFDNCSLMRNGPNNGVDYNWGNRCEVEGVTDIVCSNTSGGSYSGELLPLYAGDDPDNSKNLNVNAGDVINCSIGNHRVEPKLKISRSNNANSVLKPGDNLEQTITIKVEDNNVSNLKLTDLLPNGFKFRAGSYSIVKNGTTPITLANDPQYHSPGVWELGDFEKGDVITIKYLADISSDTLPGTYTDLAYASANDAYHLGNSYLATGENSEYVDENYVGTDVEIVKEQTNEETYNVEKKVEGQVLGASTSLPATGASPFWPILALLGLAFGIRLIRSSNKSK